MPSRLTFSDKKPRLTFTREFDITMYNRLQELEDMIEAGILVKKDEAFQNSATEDLPEASSKPSHGCSGTLPYAKIQALYNDICKSLPTAHKLSDGRKRALKARINEGYTLEDFERLFTAAQGSSFLTGKNERGWRANFDWLVGGNNMAKVLDGNYTSAVDNAGVSAESSYDIGSFDALAVQFPAKE